MQLTPYAAAGGIEWHYTYSPSRAYLKAIIESYDLHELVEEDLTARRTQDKIDVYDNCLFVVLHFPKYRQDLKKYMVNEFNVIVGQNYLITLTSYKTNHVEKVKEEYIHEIENIEEDEKFKRSPYYILYRLIDAMYDKILHALILFTQDIRLLEEEAFDESHVNKDMLENIMIKRRNIVALKHMLLPQEEILQELHKEVLKVIEANDKQLDVYVEDLEYKLGRIMTMIATVSEDVDSLYNTYGALVNIRTNSIIGVLTIFTSITGVLTLLAGFYGMNVKLPYDQTPYAWLLIFGSMLVCVIVLMIVFKRKNWI